MREELIDLLHFLKTLYVSDSRTIHTCSRIDDEMIKNYTDTIEKILSNEVILVDKNKLENKFKDVPVTEDRALECVILEKNFSLHSQTRISNFEYQHDFYKKDFQDYISKMLSMRLLNYFVEEVGCEKEVEK